MSMRKFFNVAMEDALETEKLLQSSEVAAKSGDFGSLKNELSAKLENMTKQRDNPVNQGSGSSDYSSSDDSSSSEDDGGDSSGMDDMDMSMDEEPQDEPSEEDLEEEPEKESDKESEKKDEKEDSKEEDKQKDKEATESASVYRNLSLESIELEFSQISTEGYSASQIAGSLWEGTKAAGGAIYAVGSALAYVGVNILAPAFKKLYKAVVYLSAKFIRYTHAGITKLDNEIEEYTTRLSKTEEELQEAMEVVSLLRKKKQEFPDSVPESLEVKFDKVKVINHIKIGDQADPLVTMKALEQFLKKWHSKISRDIENDSASIKHVLHYGHTAVINPVKAFGDSSLRKGLVSDPKVTHEPKNGFVASLRYPETLPGDMVYCCAVPNGAAKSLEDVKMAYEASVCNFVIDPSNYSKVEQLDYMDLDHVEQSIQSAVSLVKLLKEQKAVYESIKKEKLSYLNSFKRYIYKLAEENKRISLEKSMLEYVYLRGAFIDSVYVVTAKDIHLFSQRYLANVMTYLRSNLAELSS